MPSLPDPLEIRGHHCGPLWGGVVCVRARARACLRSPQGCICCVTHPDHGLLLQGGDQEAYPPLPAYDQQESREVFIVQVRGLPWSCTVHDLLHFFSGESERDG